MKNSESIYTGTVPLPELKRDSAEDAAASAKANVKKEEAEESASEEKKDTAARENGISVRNGGFKGIFRGRGLFKNHGRLARTHGH